MDLELLERIEKHKKLKKRFEAILDIAEAQVEGADTADVVEERTIVEVRNLGQEMLEDWANDKSSREVSKYKKEHPNCQSYKKK